MRDSLNITVTLRTAHNPPEIWTRYLQNASVKHYRYISLLGEYNVRAADLE
jgi:hypothetical protein